jgi:putative PIN family toxin of toxin-antitoxin system
LTGASARVVLDTNVLLDLWLFDDPSVRPLRQAIESGRVEPLRSRACDEEFAAVLARDSFGLKEPRQRALLAKWSGFGTTLQRLDPAPLACADPDDQKFLDAAFTGGADLLLTRDNALLQLARQAAALGLRIARPAAVSLAHAAGAAPH